MSHRALGRTFMVRIPGMRENGMKARGVDGAECTMAMEMYMKVNGCKINTMDTACSDLVGLDLI